MVEHLSQDTEISQLDLIFSKKVLGKSERLYYDLSTFFNQNIFLVKTSFFIMVFDCKMREEIFFGFIIFSFVPIFWPEMGH